jgi:hypothetical protein
MRKQLYRKLTTELQRHLPAASKPQVWLADKFNIAGLPNRQSPSNVAGV